MKRRYNANDINLKFAVEENMNASELFSLNPLKQIFSSSTKEAIGRASAEADGNLPCRTEVFISDPHGEYEEFSHIVRSGCGSIRREIETAFDGKMTTDEKRAFATLIYYPHEKIELELEEAPQKDQWYEETFSNLLTICRRFAIRHSLADFKEAVPQGFEEVFERLLVLEGDEIEAQIFRRQILDTAVDQGCATDILEALCVSIQNLATDRLHLLGDIYDRGPHPDLIMDEIANNPHLDIQWGNHDIVWMGAALGQEGCLTTIVRICARYGNLSVLEDTYGIDLQPLYDFAQRAYADDPCIAYGLKGGNLGEEAYALTVKVQKAMAIIQFKVEGALIDENPSFGLESRKLLDKIDYDRGTVVVEGKEYEMTDKLFPTVNPHDPYKLTEEEAQVLNHLKKEFLNCERLQKHIKLFLDRGSLYKIENNSILTFHACVPLNADGTLKEVEIYGKTYKGRSLFDAVERMVYDAFEAKDPEAQKRGRDLLWWLWLGEGSPLFAKSKMATFELYVIEDKDARKEVKNPFYTLYEDEAVLARIFEDFGMDPEKSHMVCGHVPVKVKDGENPLKGNGKLIIIDGGMSKPYQSKTGIAGMTLVCDSSGMTLYEFEPFVGREAAVRENEGLIAHDIVVERASALITVADADCTQ
ncbi:MAG: fructose-bisphosphatase class III [Eggerthellaceae bacterium]